MDKEIYQTIGCRAEKWKLKQSNYKIQEFLKTYLVPGYAILLLHTAALQLTDVSCNVSKNKYFKGSVQRKLAWVENSVNHWDLGTRHYFAFFNSPPSCTGPVSISDQYWEIIRRVLLQKAKRGAYFSVLRLFFRVPYTAPIILALRILIRFRVKLSEEEKMRRFSLLAKQNSPRITFRRTECIAFTYKRRV
jgi:hypothetical protein